ncbi:M20/M25/M40 family metallo-hydrolase [Pontibacter oryzae]|uniref:Vacuolar membrane protease n=1 Tax=Pontibacter oryzae TaxID=2304593 RepID=A0A399RZI6_9BACT|nr:M20/M25/M40 family metallo-hydrolase [Pontibacter oryzae]RIJ37350.1 M20/M25/M40 family metallo-hydrolase [Pontibacter oryzae]
MQNRNRVLAAFILLAITGLALLSLYLLSPPKPVPATASATVFSAERAMQHVHQMAQEPHAMGTAAHARVREYLLGEMQQLGLQPQVQEATVVNSRNGMASVGHVYNLLGRLPGTTPDSSAILLVAHYDSQPNARGAGDDAAGVAAILETIRALKTIAPLRHDIIVLLTDGEEYGLYGARAFLKHPWAKEVALVLNLEARGNSGPSMTFELSPYNGWLADQYAQAAPYPFISSLAYEVYKRMPNDTDFTVFKEAGYSGLNSAFIDGLVHYHKTTDAPENLDTGSLQQHGSNLLALVKRFDSSEFTQTKAPDRVFFNAAGNWVVSYGSNLNIVWVALTTLLLVATCLLGIRKRVFSVRQALLGLLAFLVLVVVVALLFIPINNLVLDLLPVLNPHLGLHATHTFFVAYLLLALGLSLLLLQVALRWVNPLSIFMGAIILLYFLMLGLYLLLPLAAYLLLFPVLFALAGAFVMFLLELNKQQGWKYALVLLAAADPAIFIVFPVVQIVFLAFGMSMPLGTVVLFLLLVGLLLPLLLFALQCYTFGKVPALPLAALLVGIVFLMLAINNQTPTPERPLRSHVSYYLNADTGQAFWASAYTLPDMWNKQFFNEPVVEPLKEVYPHAGISYLKSKAEAVNLPAPVAEVLQDTVIRAERILRLRLTSQRGAAHMELVLQPEPASALLQASVAGEPLQLEPITIETGEVYFMRLHGLPVSKTVDLELHLTPKKPLTVYLYDQVIGLPAQLVKQAKPAHVIAESGRDSNLTVVQKSYTF